MFNHVHPYKPFIPKGTTKLIVGTLPPPRFSMGKLKTGDVNFCYGSIDGQLWKILNEIFSLNLHFENTDFAIQQRKDFLIANNIGICDIVESCERIKMDASDLGMSKIKFRDLLFYLKKNPSVNTLLLTGGNSKNGPEYHLRRQLKTQNMILKSISAETPKIHEFEFKENETTRKIKVISLTAPSGSANRAVGSNPQYQLLKKQNPKFNTFDFRVLQYKEYF